MNIILISIHSIIVEDSDEESDKSENSIEPKPWEQAYARGNIQQ